MKYRLTTEDWLKLNYYLLETKKSEKIKLLFFRISVMVVLGVVLFMVAGETANAWGVFLYLIFFIPGLGIILCKFNSLRQEKSALQGKAE